MSSSESSPFWRNSSNDCLGGEDFFSLLDDFFPPDEGSPLSKEARWSSKEATTSVGAYFPEFSTKERKKSPHRKNETQSCSNAHCTGLEKRKSDIKEEN